MSRTQRDNLIARAQKLRAMTIANGCSEAEAAFAVRKLAELIAEHNLTQDELSIRREAAACHTDHLAMMEESYKDWMQVQPAIGKLFTCKAYFSIKSEDVFDLGFFQKVTYIKFFGAPVDVSAALAMTEICGSAINTVSYEWIKTNKGKVRKNSYEYNNMLKSFRVGMADRLVQRIKELQPVVQTGTALMVLKDQLVTDEWAKQNMKLRPTRRTTATHAGAYSAGSTAANNVGLGYHQFVSGTRQLTKS